MGHTNSTANLSLPQFIGTDKPTFLGDINTAFSDIDAYVGTNDAAVSGAVSDAASAVSQAASAVSTANAANTTAGNASTAATNAVGTANNAMSLVNQTNTKIGTLANLNTTDKTSIVNAINEVEGQVNPGSVSITADGVKTYGQVLDDLFALVDASKINTKSSLVIESGSTKYVFGIESIGVAFSFSAVRQTASATTIEELVVASSSSYVTSYNGTVTDSTNNAASSGMIFTIVY